jgi:hypothetical protein
MTGLQLAQELRQRMPEAMIILLIKDQQQARLISARHTQLDFPSILKPFVNRTLPRLLSEKARLNLL